MPTHMAGTPAPRKPRKGNNMTAPEYPITSPVIGGSQAFEIDNRHYLLRVEIPLTAEQMAAALYAYDHPSDARRVLPLDTETDEDVWRHIAVVVVSDGLHAIENLAALEIPDQEIHGTLASPAWLRTCRRRTAEIAREPEEPWPTTPTLVHQSTRRRTTDCD